MKKNVIGFVLMMVLCLATMVGCNKEQKNELVEEPTSTVETTEETETSIGPTTPTTTSSTTTVTTTEKTTVEKLTISIKETTETSTTYAAAPTVKETQTKAATTETTRKTIKETTTPATTSTTEATTTTTEPVQTTTVSTTLVSSTSMVKEYIGYKPNTHYVHRSTCHWFDDTCYAITSTEGLEARKCSECKPDIEIITPYTPPAPTVNCSLTDYEYNLIMQLMANEYGGKASVIERAKIVAATMNACKRNGWSVETFVYRACVPFGFTPGYSSYHGTRVSDMKDAMDYYFTYGEKDFYTIGYWQEGADSWYGDGTWNHFYRA